MNVRSHGRLVLLFGAGIGVALGLGLGSAPAAQAQGVVDGRSSPSLQAAGAGREGPSWRQLTPAQQAALRPLERDWPTIDGVRKRKWLEIAARYPTMAPDEQQRLQARMAEWARMSTEERRNARLNFREVRELGGDQRRDRWEAYQSLSEEERERLAARARQAVKKPPSREAGSGVKPTSLAEAGPAAAPRAAVPSRNAAPGGVAKSNIVPIPATATPPKPVAPALVKGGPGATTTFITKKPTPPWHQQPGLPKIAATPEFVDPHTLLPRVGPQGVAAAPAATDPAPAR